MSGETNAKIVERYVFDMFETRDTSRFDELIASNVLYRSPISLAAGLDSLKDVVARATTSLQESRMTIDWTCCEGERVICRGVHRGIFLEPFQGLQPTGRRFVLPMLIACQLKHGLIVDIEVMYDSRNLAEQTGQSPTVTAAIDPQALSD